jgi:ApeA N-terminal domain 1
MMKELEGTKQVGAFSVPPGRDLHGELTLAGSKTSLYLRDKEFFLTDSPDRCLNGVLHDLKRVSLLGCISPGTGTAFYGSEGYHFSEVFPHFVIYGNQHIGSQEKRITEIDFVIEDATTLFYDFDAFGNVLDAGQFIGPIIAAREKAYNRTIKTGPAAQLLYFTGNLEIFAADTVLGRISASHAPGFNLGGPEGVWLKNTIFVTIAFKEELIFGDAIFHTSTLLRYLGMLVGRPQNILSLSLRVKEETEVPNTFQVYWSMPPSRDSSKERGAPHPGDILLDVIREPQQFSSVLASWLQRQECWHDARMRFFNSFAEQRHYDIDRMIGSANMFDILPSSAVPTDATLSDDVKSAIDCSRRLFKTLPLTQERNSILDALGRAAKSNLKHKIRHRAQLVISALGSRFDELTMVTDHAVNCRNHYVHGSEPTFDYGKNFDAVVFFTDTLEFVFAASDLIEAGWDIKAWAANPTGMAHPFGAYRAEYPRRLASLKALLG